MDDEKLVDVLVVVPVHNGGPFLARQLVALADQEFSGRYELLVINNGSTDDSLAMAQGLAFVHPVLQVIDAPTVTSISMRWTTGLPRLERPRF